MISNMICGSMSLSPVMTLYEFIFMMMG